jgi:hypothetical protein
MVADIVTEKMSMASGFLDRVAEMGFSSFSNCNAVLDEIKLFIHEPELRKLIDDKEWELIDLHSKQFEERTKALEKMGCYERFLMQSRISFELERWKCEQRLSFYDWLSKKYDIGN